MFRLVAQRASTRDCDAYVDVSCNPDCDQQQAIAIRVGRLGATEPLLESQVLGKTLVCVLT